MGDTSQTQSRTFNSLTAAEQAYRQQLENNQQLGEKIDGLAQKIDTLTDSIANLVSVLTPRPPHTTTPVPRQEEEPVRTNSPAPSNLTHSEENPRRQFLERDRSHSAVPAATDESESEITSRKPHYKGLAGVKLPVLLGNYEEDVNAWISTIEDQFFIYNTPEKYKVASISPLLEEAAKTWYIWLKGEYRRRLTWREFKMELKKKFIESATRMQALRDKLQVVPYNGLQRMDEYVIQFRILEQQISTKEMAFGDRVNYFIAPLEKELQRRIKLEKPKNMEYLYDAAQDWARTMAAYMDDPEPEPPDNETGTTPSLLIKKGKGKEKEKQLDSEDEDELDVLKLRVNSMDMNQVRCYTCQRRGHFARDCPQNRSRRDRSHKNGPHRPIRREEIHMMANKIAQSKDDDPEYFYGMYQNDDDITVSPSDTSSSSRNSPVGPCRFMDCRGGRYCKHQ
jgi:hypothetical protein